MRLDELLEASNFREAVEGLGQEFRHKFGLIKIHQLGLVVLDVEQSAQELEAKGIGPFFIVSGRPVFWRERGEEKKFRGKMGLAYFQGFELELLEPGEGSDFYRQSLDSQGGIVVQHLGFLEQDVDQSAERLAKEGFPVLVRGKLKSGPLSIDFAYLDTTAPAGVVIEFISWKFFGLNFSPPQPLCKMLAQLEKWSGKRSVSL